MVCATSKLKACCTKKKQCESTVFGKAVVSNQGASRNSRPQKIQSHKGTGPRSDQHMATVNCKQKVNNQGNRKQRHVSVPHVLYKSLHS